MYPWHKTQLLQLESARQNGRLPHALLFVAAEGCGHETFIDNFSQSLLCAQPDATGLACGQCRSCEVFQASASAHPDFAEVKKPDDKQIIGVDQIRALNHFLELSRSYSPVRVAVIRDAELMNVNAANSLLKTLEEPAPDTHIILYSHQSNHLLPTIRSRCQQVRMTIPARAEALSWLENQQSTQQLTQSPTVLFDLAGGRLLHALALDDGVLLEKQKTWLNQLLGLLQNKSAIASVATDWGKQDKRELLDWQIALVQKLLREQFAGEGIAIAAATPGNNTGDNGIASLAKLMKNNNLWLLNDNLLKLKALSAHPLNAQLFAANMLSLWLNI